MNYYEILEVSENASTEVIKMAYKALAKKYHPDMYSEEATWTTEAMKHLNEALEVLSDPGKRRVYDEYLVSTRSSKAKEAHRGSNFNKSAENNNASSQASPPPYQAQNSTTSTLPKSKKKTAITILVVCIIVFFTANAFGLTIHRDMDYAGGHYVGDATLLGVPQGNGKISYPAGNVNGVVTYDGEWEKGCKEGQGSQTWESGDTYSGQWKNDLYVGPGTYKWKNGDIFKGTFTFSDDQNAGGGNAAVSVEGLTTFANGNSWNGKILKGAIIGQGTYKWASGAYYTGDYTNGIPNGNAVYVYEDGSTYTGHFINGIHDGQGTSTYPNGGKYVGEWKNDLPNGQGIYYFPEGGNVSGTFKNGYCKGYRCVYIID